MTGKCGRRPLFGVAMTPAERKRRQRQLLHERLAHYEAALRAIAESYEWTCRNNRERFEQCVAIALDALAS